MGKLGIEKLTNLVMLTVAIFNQGKESIADGFQLTDLFSFFDEALQIEGAVKSLAEVKAEIDDLSMEERQQLIDAIMAELNVDSEKAREVLAHAIDLAAAAYGLVLVLRK